MEKLIWDKENMTRQRNKKKYCQYKFIFHLIVVFSLSLFVFQHLGINNVHRIITLIVGSSVQSFEQFPFSTLRSYTSVHFPFCFPWQKTRKWVFVVSIITPHSFSRSHSQRNHGTVSCLRFASTRSVSFGFSATKSTKSRFCFPSVIAKKDHL